MTLIPANLSLSNKLDCGRQDSCPVCGVLKNAPKENRSGDLSYPVPFLFGQPQKGMPAAAGRG